MDTPAIAWGLRHEAAALALYARRTGAAVRAVGVLFHPQLEYVGASPDGMIDGGCVEVKCPYNEEGHAKTLLHGMPQRHQCQVQAQAFVTGRAFVDFVSYDPRRRGEDMLFVQRIAADAEYHEKLRARCEWFWEAVRSGGRLSPPPRPGSVS